MSTENWTYEDERADFASDPALVAAHVEHGLVDEEEGRQEGETGVAQKRTLCVISKSDGQNKSQQRVVVVVPVVVAKDWRHRDGEESNHRQCLDELSTHESSE